MTEFTTRTTSPFRYDIVGSFLRPQELKEARAKFANGEITQADLTAVRTIPFRVDTLNNKSANSRGCFSFLVIPQQKN